MERVLSCVFSCVERADKLVSLILGIVALGGCARSDIYSYTCNTPGAVRPCQSACGRGFERCEDQLWQRCDAPEPKPPADQIAILGTIRDFHTTHPDFERPLDEVGDDRGIIASTLGADGEPAYAHADGTQTVSSPESFFQWFHDDATVNVGRGLTLTLKKTSSTPLVYSFDNQSFFPIDDQLFGDEGNPHNFHFTLELHTSLVYRGGEELHFQGDDDLFVFIDKRLVIDLGGAHPPESGTVRLDDLDLSRGAGYSFDIFFSERHTTQSTLHIETTNAQFVNCP